MLWFTGQALGSGDPATADRRETESDSPFGRGGRIGWAEPSEPPEAHRVRVNPLRDDDGRHPLAALQTPPGHGRRRHPSPCQKGRSRRHSRVHPLPTSTPKGPSANRFSVYFLLLLLLLHFQSRWWMDGWMDVRPPKEILLFTVYIG